MELRIGSPRTPLEWIVSILIFGVVVALAITLMGVVIVGVAVALIAAPIFAWWRRRKGLAYSPRSAESPLPGPTPIDSLDGDSLDGPVIDAEFEVKDDG